MDFEKILTWAIGVIAAIIAAGFTFKFIISNKKVDNSQTIKVNQKNNHAGGDIVGGNKIINKK